MSILVYYLLSLDKYFGRYEFLKFYSFSVFFFIFQKFVGSFFTEAQLARATDARARGQGGVHVSCALTGARTRRPARRRGSDEHGFGGWMYAGTNGSAQTSLRAIPYLKEAAKLAFGRRSELHGDPRRRPTASYNDRTI